MSKRPTVGKVKQGITFVWKELWEITISTENRIIVEQATHKPNRVEPKPEDDGKPPILVGEVSLIKIVMLAKQNPEMTFTSLAHRIDLSLL